MEEDIKVVDKREQIAKFLIDVLYKDGCMKLPNQKPCICDKKTDTPVRVCKDCNCQRDKKE